MNFIRVLIINKLFGINMFSLRIFKVIFAAFVAALAFKVIINYTLNDIGSNLGIALGIPTLTFIYLASVYIFAMEKSDKTKIKNKLFKKNISN